MASTGNPITDRKAYEATRAAVKSIELSGGVKGYDKWVAANGGPPPKAASKAKTATSNAGKLSDGDAFVLTATWGTLIAKTWISCEGTQDSGSGGAWGIGLGGGEGVGPLEITTDWATFKAATAGFSLGAAMDGEGGAVLTFLDSNNSIIGTAELVVDGAGVTVGIQGDFSWD